MGGGGGGGGSGGGGGGLASGSSGCGPVGLVSVSSSPPPSHGRLSSVLALAGNYLSLPSPCAVIAWTPAT